MSDVSVLSRIDEIRATMATLALGPPGRSGGPTSSGAAFASSLALATGSGTNRAGSAAAGGDGDAVVADARRYLGIPYLWGGTDPGRGLDCSGLVQRVFADLGVDVPRTVSQQKDAGVAVPSMDDARPGDLLVFGNHHIGIYVGDGKMLHAPKSGDVVKITDVYQTPTRIRRVVPAGDGVLDAAAATARPSALRQNVSTASAFDPLFAAATQRYDLPAGLVKSVARAESGLDAGARSSAGAIGLMQLMPGTARGLGVDPTNPAQAVDGAARLLRQHLDSFGSIPLALAAYNAGPGAVRKYDGIPPYGETQAYVRRVVASLGAST